MHEEKPEWRKSSGTSLGGGLVEKAETEGYFAIRLP